MSTYPRTMRSPPRRIPEVLMIVLLLTNGNLVASAGASIRGVHREEPAEGPGAGVSERTVKRMGAVVNALTDLLSSIESEEKDDAARYKCFMEWCDKALTLKKGAIEEGGVALENNRVEADQHTSAIASTKYELTKLATETEETQDALSKAEELRNKENAKYTDEKTRNVQSIKQLEQAIKIVRQGSVEGLLQRGKRSDKRGKAPGESSMILGTFKGLKQTMERNQQKADGEEADGQKMYNQLYAVKTGQLKGLTKSAEKKQVTLADSQVGLAEAKNDIATISDALKEDKAFLSETKQSCAEKEKEWQVRSEDRAQEKAAIREAISFLVVSFEKPAEEMLLQDKHAVSTAHGFSLLQSRAGAHERVSSGDVAVGMLESTRAQLAFLTGKMDSATRADGFAKVKLTIKDLIEVLKSEQNEEYEKSKMCKAELKSKGSQKEKTSDQLGMLGANVESTSNEIETLTSEVKEVEKLMDESKKEDETASKLRQDERKAFEAGSKDRKLAIKVLTGAKGVLAKFYNSAALMQKATKVSKEHWSASDTPRHTGAGNVVIAMLDNIIADVQKEQKDAEIAENEAVSAFSQRFDSSQAEYDARMEEINAKVTRNARLKVQLGNTQDTLDQQKDKMSAIKEQMKALHEDCDDLLKSFEARTKAREFEIAQLRDVIGILSGSSEAVRTGLVEESDDDAAEDHELAQLEGLSRTTGSLVATARRLVS